MLARVPKANGVYAIEFDRSMAKWVLLSFGSVTERDAYCDEKRVARIKLVRVVVRKGNEWIAADLSESDR